MPKSCRRIFVSQALHWHFHTTTTAYVGTAHAIHQSMTNPKHRRTQIQVNQKPQEDNTGVKQAKH